ncbi:bifunctional 3-phenylpropionate/cinnamic acid dioxygenase ferredoxin subunit [Kineosporia corallincola]|uniref:bifunctional 3-phenylpropionate/cinnamic acid dioxygenase ferredoxin subunit n=1 Tax=Kineosporia corallincola TaxID=2835133 RepID=UPI0027E1776E|nr:bifunctional 3-phenylpropionate/cinnamic acid dioxygenase ferredoxin subunit [Kineosporia corallincola]
MIRVCAVGDIPEGEAIRVENGPTGVPIAVFNVGGSYYAIDDTCTHQDASLADGYLEEEACAVECPLHAACFDLRTGEPSGPPARVPVRTHVVVVQGGQVLVQLQAAGTPIA